MKSTKIAAIALLAALAVPAFAAEVIVSDGDMGGAYWTSAQAGKVATTVASNEQFVATAQVSRKFSFLEDYNP